MCVTVNFRLKALVSVAFLISTDAVVAQSAQELEDGVELIIQVAEQICLNTSTSGSSSQVELDGNADASLGVLSKRLIDLGIEGAGRLNETEFSNVLREDLAVEIQDNRRCRESVFDAMFARVFLDTPDTILSDAQKAALEGRVRPHSLQVISHGERFAIKLLETRAILQETTVVNFFGLAPKTSYGPRLSIRHSNAITGQSRNWSGYIGEPVVLENGCAIVPFAVDIDLGVASFTTTCE